MRWMLPLAYLFLTGCSHLVIYEDDSALKTTGKVTVRAVNCLLTIWMGCGSEWISMAEAKAALEASPYPVTTGSYIPSKDNIPRYRRYAIWSNHPSVTDVLTSTLLSDGQTVVERHRLHQIFDEQKIRLTHTPEETEVLRVGKLAGADQIIFAETSITPETVRGAFGTSFTLYHVRVSFRSVSVESGSVIVTGSATLTKPISNPEASIGYLTHWAQARALCPLQLGAVWIEPGPYRQGGCRHQAGASR